LSIQVLQISMSQNIIIFFHKIYFLSPCGYHFYFSLCSKGELGVKFTTFFWLAQYVQLYITVH
jgi:hypothetical protein